MISQRFSDLGSMQRSQNNSFTFSEIIDTPHPNISCVVGEEDLQPVESALSLNNLANMLSNANSANNLNKPKLEDVVVV